GRLRSRCREGGVPPAVLPKTENGDLPGGCEGPPAEDHAGNPPGGHKVRSPRSQSFGAWTGPLPLYEPGEEALLLPLPQDDDLPVDGIIPRGARIRSAHPLAVQIHPATGDQPPGLALRS